MHHMAYSLVWFVWYFVREWVGSHTSSWHLYSWSCVVFFPFFNCHSPFCCFHWEGGVSVCAWVCVLCICVGACAHALICISLFEVCFTQTLCCTHLFLTILPISSLPFELKFIYFLQKEWKDGLIIPKPATRKYKSCNVQVLITVLYLSAVEPTSFSSLVTETDGDIRIITHLTETAPQNRTRHAAGFFTPLCLQRDSKGREFLQGFHCVFCFLFLLAYKLNYDCCWHNVVYIYICPVAVV